ncbi:MAG TPA: hypothetical protein VNM16_00290 [Bacillota bacterium]|nr:hypothetical protein [Bacillota bacterium]
MPVGQHDGDAPSLPVVGQVDVERFSPPEIRARDHVPARLGPG